MTIGASQEFNIVLAVDTSGSTSVNDFYLNAVSNGIPQFLNFIKETYPRDVRVGLVSWDDNVDFIIKPTDNFSMILESLKELSAREMESTDFNQALYGAESAFLYKPDKYIRSKNILIIIVEDGGEFQRISITPDVGKYTTYCIIMDSKKINSQMCKELKNLSLVSRGQFYALPSSAPGLDRVLEDIVSKEVMAYISRDARMYVNSSILKNDILAQKNNKSIIVKNAIIEGDLHLNQTHVKNELQFIDCIFNGTFDLSYTDFKSHVRFENVNFKRDSDFRNANFFSDVEFVDVQFFGRSLFSGVTFHKIALFYKNNFTKSAFFDGTKFLNMVQFERISLLNHGLFNMAIFNGKAIFRDIFIAGISFFKTSSFLSQVNFNNVTFQDQVSFAGTIFKEDIGISRSSFKSSLDISNSTIHGILSLSDSRFSKNLDFTNTSAKDIIINQPIISKTSKIFIDRLNLTNFNTHWKNIDDHVDYNKDPYLSIMSIYNKQEWFEDYDECYYDYKYEHMIAEPWGIQKIKIISSWILCGFGKRVSHILLWSLLIILMCSIIFWLGNGLEPTQQSYNHRRKRTTFFDALYFSSILFVAQAPSEFRPIERYRYLVIIEGILGWVLLGVLVAVLIGILTR